VQTALPAGEFPVIQEDTVCHADGADRSRGAAPATGGKPAQAHPASKKKTSKKKTSKA
jgi:hypothetical protein